VAQHIRRLRRCDRLTETVRENHGAPHEHYSRTLSDSAGDPIVNSGLWSLQFRDPASSFDPTALFFTARINAEADGLFGKISVALGRRVVRRRRHA